MGMPRVWKVRTKNRIICQSKDSFISILFVQEIRQRGLKVAVVGIPKTIDNDIPVLSSCIHELLLNQVHSSIIFENGKPMS